MRTLRAFPELHFPPGLVWLVTGLAAWLCLAVAFFSALALYRSPAGAIVTTTIGALAAVVSAGMFARLLADWFLGHRQ